MINDTKALTPEEFTKLMILIEKQHSFGKPNHRGWIKYVRPDFDMRDGLCFHIKIEYAGGEVEFDSRNVEVPMYVAIGKWLDTL